MAKNTAPTTTMKFKVGGSNPAAAEPGVTNYAGDVPPSGSYLFKLKRLIIKENGSGDSMFQGLAEICEPKGSKAAKYNGYGAWFQQNITDQGKGYVNQMLASFTDGSDVQMMEIKEAFWEEGPKVQKDEKKDKNGKDQFHVIKIGDFLINSPAPDIKDVYFVGAGEHKAAKGNYAEKLDINAYAPATEERIGDQGNGSSKKAVNDDLGDIDDDEDDAPKVVTEKKSKKDKKDKKAKPSKSTDDDDIDDDGEAPF